MDIAHPPEFYRHLRDIQRERGRVPKRKITPEAIGAIKAAVARGAFTPDRVAHYAEQVIDADSDAEREEVIAAIDSLVGRDGRAAPDDGEGEWRDRFAALYPPEPGREREWEAAADRIAASQAAADADSEDFSHLYPPTTGEEADQRITASRRPRPQRAAEEWSDEELHAACFGDAEWGPGAAGRPVGKRVIR